MGRGRIVNALSFFVFLKNVFLNKAEFNLQMQQNSD